MKKLLLISQNQEIAQTILRLVDGLGDFVSSYVATVDELKRELDKSQYDILLIGSGFNQEEEKLIKKTALESYPQIKTVEHYGGGSGLLYSELAQATN